MVGKIDAEVNSLVSQRDFNCWVLINNFHPRSELLVKL